MRHLPLYFDTRASRLLLVGSGDEAVRRLRLLQSSQAHITVIAPTPTQELVQRAEAHAHTSLHQREFTHQDLEHVQFVFLAPKNALERKQAKAIATAARAGGIAVNAMDDKELCDFYVPSMVNREPIVVAIGSEGTAPLLARNLKARIERLLPQHLGAAARYAGELRTTIRKRLSAKLRRTFWERFFASDTIDKIAHGIFTRQNPKQLADRLINELQNEKATMRLDIVVAGDTINELSHHAHEALLQADSVIYDDDIAQAILNLARRDAQFIAGHSGSFAPMGAFSRHNDNEHSSHAGDRIVRVLHSNRAAIAERQRYHRLLPHATIELHLLPTEKEKAA